MSQLPEQITYSNEWGTEILGPIGEKDKLSENLNTNYVYSIHFLRMCKVLIHLKSVESKIMFICSLIWLKNSVKMAVLSKT